MVMGPIHFILHSLDTEGRRVLIGLSYEETKEFEKLDERMDALPSEFGTLPATDDRWQELYEKHRAACRRIQPTY